MKLTAPWIDEIRSQFDMNVIPEDNPVCDRLCAIFGAHTFFVGDNGLHIVEKVEPLGPDGEARELLKVASWADDERGTLTAHEPELVEVVVVQDDGRGRTVNGS